MKTTLASLALLLAVSASAQVVVDVWQRLEGQHSRMKESLAVAVQSREKWEEIWRRHDPEAPVPQVDFEKESVVVVFIGETARGGVTVDVIVQKDPIDSNRLNVFYREIVTRKSFTTQVECQPFAIVKVPKAATIDVERDGAVSAPERPAAPANPRDARKMRGYLERLAAPIDWN